MEGIQQRQESALGVLKAKTEEEFLVKIGAKEEEFIWDPRIVNEPFRRITPFVGIEYQRPACYRAKPRFIPVSPWRCHNQACRQLALASRFGPRNYFINNQRIHEASHAYLKRATTQSFGLCYDPMTVESL